MGQSNKGIPEINVESKTTLISRNITVMGRRTSVRLKRNIGA